MTPKSGPVLLVGCGRMGGALLRGWIGRGIPKIQITVIEPETAFRAMVEAEHGVIAIRDASEIPPALKPAVIVLAVKPQVMDQVLPPYARYSEAVFLSIAAGKKIAALKTLLGTAAIVRAMPNLPAAIGQGVTVACADPSVGGEARSRCRELLAAVGEVAFIENEDLMDAVTAVSGSGPAYVFLLAECLAEAGAAAGLDPDLALKLACATVAGSGALLGQSGETPARLRENVTSPGGTTAAALAVLMANEGMPDLLKRAVAAAAKRSRELSSH